MTTFQRTVESFQQGSFTMPAEQYVSPAVFAEEVDRIGQREWHCVGRAERIAKPGDYFLKTVAGESLIVLRDRHGQVRAHFNVCRHRGTQICETESGRFSEPWARRSASRPGRDRAAE